MAAEAVKNLTVFRDTGDILMFILTVYIYKVFGDFLQLRDGYLGRVCETAALAV